MEHNNSHNFNCDAHRCWLIMVNVDSKIWKTAIWWHKLICFLLPITVVFYECYCSLDCDHFSGGRDTYYSLNVERYLSRSWHFLVLMFFFHYSLHIWKSVPTIVLFEFISFNWSSVHYIVHNWKLTTLCE